VYVCERTDAAGTGAQCCSEYRPGAEHNESEVLRSPVDTRRRSPGEPDALAGERLLRGKTCRAQIRILTDPALARFVRCRRGRKD